MLNAGAGGPGSQFEPGLAFLLILPCSASFMLAPWVDALSQQTQRIHVHQHRGLRNLVPITKRQRPTQNLG